MATLFEKLQLQKEEYRKRIEEIDLLVSLLQKYGIEDVIAEDQQGEAEKLFEAVGDKAASMPPAGKRRRLFDFTPLRSHPPSTTDRPSRNLPRKRMSQVVTQILTERQKPMTRNEMVDALELKGIPVAGVDPPKAIGTILWRMRDEFVNLPGWGYWLIGEDFAPAAYKGLGQAPLGEAEDDETQSQTALGLPKPDEQG
ncbi:hypothetical protein [Mesorhizobium sp. M0408]|uniref:hypothetical protein n=1 Tax=Mesorhizobium sp. M0408 TaxID=2956942 RepID=UPI00333B0B06